MSDADGIQFEACPPAVYLAAVKRCALVLVSDGKPGEAVSLIVEELPRHPAFRLTQELNLNFVEGLAEAAPKGTAAVRAWINAFNPHPAPAEIAE